MADGEIKEAVETGTGGDRAATVVLDVTNCIDGIIGIKRAAYFASGGGGGGGEEDEEGGGGGGQPGGKDGNSNEIKGDRAVLFLWQEALKGTTARNDICSKGAVQNCLSTLGANWKVPEWHKGLLLGLLGCLSQDNDEAKELLSQSRSVGYIYDGLSYSSDTGVSGAAAILTNLAEQDDTRKRLLRDGLQVSAISNALDRSIQDIRLFLKQNSNNKQGGKSGTEQKSKQQMKLPSTTASSLCSLLKKCVLYNSDGAIHASIVAGGIVELLIELLQETRNASSVSPSGDNSNSNQLGVVRDHALACLCGLSERKDAAAKLSTPRAMTSFVDILKEEKTSFEVKSSAAGVLYNITRPDDRLGPPSDADAQDFSDVEIPMGVADAVLVIDEMPEFQKLRVLAEYPLSDGQLGSMRNANLRVQFIVDAGAIRPLVALLKPNDAPGGDDKKKKSKKKSKKSAVMTPELARAVGFATGCLRHLTVSPEARRSVLTNEGIPQLVSLTQQGNSTVRWHALGVLYNLGMDKALEADLTKAGAPPSTYFQAMEAKDEFWIPVM